MSQIPSRTSRDARRSRDRYDRCPVCQKTDVDGLHVDRCRDTEEYRQAALKAGRAAGIPDATTADLWAHAHSRLINPIYATRAVRLVIDLGWRPVVGSDPNRLWATPADPTTERTEA